MEYLEGGELWNRLMYNNHQIGIDEDSARFYVADMILALEYIHSMGVVHR